MKTLQLTLKKKWFDLMITGEKTEEFRVNKPYWVSRLEGKEYDRVRFTNGYGKDRPWFEAEFKGWDAFPWSDERRYSDGSVLEIPPGTIVIKLGGVVDKGNL